MSRDSLTAVFRSGPAMVVSTLLAVGFLVAVGWKARELVAHLVAPARAEGLSVADKQELLERMDKLGVRLDAFNTRLSWLEGATSGALKQPIPPDVRASGVGR